MYQTSNSTTLPRHPIENDVNVQTLYLNAIESLEKLITCMKDSQKESGLSSEEESFLSFLEEDLSFKKKETGLILPRNSGS